MKKKVKYIIKKTYEATSNNPNFYGTKEATQIWYSGKGNTNSSKCDNLFIKHNAYSDESTLARGLRAAKAFAKKEEDLGYWTIKVEPVEV